ncbi:hypothetical protein E2562_021386 [Oryza meyeriana var. granulata]|uniref:Uncharacterized protein n=1 Tax=Oryza meyeriana var. granulata TaxID=110450 RepID=A0A6G1EXF9_9ORYZ|nr:hypothetical protein E2562_021386 [Oryza meyeriana var. granulata]
MASTARVPVHFETTRGTAWLHLARGTSGQLAWPCEAWGTPGTEAARDARDVMAAHGTENAGRALGAVTMAACGASDDMAARGVGDARGRPGDDGATRGVGDGGGTTAAPTADVAAARGAGGVETTGGDR